ncbi:methylated-DNA--[protein]-cysteine S-methyltransferase [Aliivibrio fischeri]|uniref:Methylated-DNA--protein-cysteine methyltransferase n=1 Tax=Aliivibrio fischeri TaxID=668 RepID=Q84B87_ALIFS|nr:methylated-DNA--[protein]-cysteine S-methyltransferase [Aliivibrio fischeri]AAO38242.1 Orfc668-1 [Aliivibrio fischeri]MUH98712.1 methylated-DNA--[protein]-cysteine S-methyltransferase [Aliivibrio fischeri]MUI65927.1 methylated-DNA--[protein]-cysteine S-methyltransferase [Aliivibrio fischeri]USR97159.1 methylated-DNA--[protein]-cysteine S-methyltransferase [Aliivibrio fischeri ATCC 7744 = JCM 18803 = DSM 507]GGK51520.1 methylated-DNA--protein-cysteine methyltransferase [Aliivibrio fischeri]
MNQINIQHFKHPYAEFVLGSYDGKLCLCDFRYRKMRSTVDDRIKRSLNAEFVERNDDVLESTKTQLEEYFLGERSVFDIPLLLVGTDFQKSVWGALNKVKYGDIVTYQDLALSIGNESAVRAVGNANGANGLAIIIPCHRVIGSQGELVGYGGGLSLKKRLLELERNLFI